MREQELGQKIWDLLPRVSKPARYVGNEWNALLQDHGGVDLKVALAFPELYEIGMSNLGIKILYGLINRRGDMLAERVFAPATDMEALMEQEDIPLFTLESFTPVKDFDVVGFSLQHELNYNNVLNMLYLAGIPLYGKERSGYPLVIGGGTCTFNPEPLAPFLDLFVLGEGEEVFPEILETFREIKNGQGSKEEILYKLAGVEGVYVPSLYEPFYDSGGVFKGTVPVREGVPPVVTKRVLPDLDSVYYPLEQMVPYMEVVHDRAVLEIARGCPRGCRFCHAGVAYRPVRFRSPENLSRMGQEIINSTGYEELSLVSLSSTDYPYMEELLGSFSSCLSGVNLSLPSQRLDAFSVELAKEVQKKHKTSLTFAPEAGTERLRKVINKDITDNHIYEAVSRAFDAGWRLIKLYFMIGLPTERDEDLEGIYHLSAALLDIYRRKAYRERLKISVSVSALIPKPHTPFQWEPQITLEQCYRKIKLLRGMFSRSKQLELKWHEPEMSLLEAALSRGDRRLSQVLERAWRKGSRLDNWSEFFSLSNWEQAFSEAGLSVYDYAQRSYSYQEALPWSHLSTGVSEKFLKKESLRARETELSPGCLEEKCAGCGMIYCAGRGEMHDAAH